ncbi:MAG: 16S rRNA (cytosine(1402)-N(4))-methyltransferase [Desulfobulbus propionicus]|nr:MAG: 16S rRNA (cytosine(1402)-N(4))-methyltransferase [Desulfobulbus propionicus]
MGGSGQDIHVPVLAREIVHWLAAKPGGIYVDTTLGLGGHTTLIVEHQPDVQQVYGFEWDSEAAHLAADRLQGLENQVTVVNSSYSNLVHELRQRGVEKVDGIIADFGVSSLQLDCGERGFSFRQDGPLDMRMSNQVETTAAELVAHVSEEQLADIFYHYGEERQARRIARFVVQKRQEVSIRTTGQLAEIVAHAVPLKYHPKKIHVATKVFQALRIAVNREFDNITSLIESAPAVLAEGGHICLISFHSIEDRIIKQGLAANPAYRVVSKKPIVPSEEEIASNPRARSAKLRVARKRQTSAQ